MKAVCCVGMWNLQVCCCPSKTVAGGWNWELLETAVVYLLVSGYLIVVVAVVVGVERKIWPPRDSGSGWSFPENVASWQQSLRQGMSRKSPHFVAEVGKALLTEGRKVAAAAAVVVVVVVVAVVEAVEAVRPKSAPGDGLRGEDEQDGMEEVEEVGEGSLAPDDVT
jgi:hypothetical protein